MATEQVVIVEAEVRDLEQRLGKLVCAWTERLTGDLEGTPSSGSTLTAQVEQTQSVLLALNRSFEALANVRATLR